VPESFPFPKVLAAMSIRRHLILLLVIAVASLLFLGASSFFQFQRNTAQVRALTDGALPGFLSAAELSPKLKDMQIAVTAYVYAPDVSASPSREVLEVGRKSLQDGLEEQAGLAQSDAFATAYCAGGGFRLAT